MDTTKRTQNPVGSKSVSSGYLLVVPVKRTTPPMSKFSNFGESVSHCAILTPATETAQVFESLAVSAPLKRIRLSYNVAKASIRTVAPSQKIEHPSSTAAKESRTNPRSEQVETTLETDVNSMVMLQRLPAEIRGQIFEQLDLQVSRTAFTILSIYYPTMAFDSLFAC